MKPAQYLGGFCRYSPLFVVLFARSLSLITTSRIQQKLISKLKNWSKVWTTRVSRHGARRAKN